MAAKGDAMAVDPIVEGRIVVEEENGLVGYWKLSGDGRDYSGTGNHGKNHDVDLDTGEFNSRTSYLGVEDSESLRFGTSDFSICVAVYTEDDMDSVIGNVLSKYDPGRREGFTLGIKASSGGYNSQGNDKHVYFGIDDGKVGDWVDCSRPSANSNYAGPLTVFDGKLYVATTDAENVEDWCRVYRYEGDGRWEDCGRVGNRRTPGVGPMIVHNGDLYAATWSYEFGEGRKRKIDTWDYCSVYRYAGGREWEEWGRPGKSRRLLSMASYRGKLYIISDGATIDPDARCYVYRGGKEWSACGEFEDLPACLAVHHGKLYMATSEAGRGGGEVYVYDGETWEPLGNPFGYALEWNPAISANERLCTQIHAMQVYGGELYAGCWPNGNVAVRRDGKWEDCGVTADRRERIEINSLTVYNGKLYAGTLPRAGVWRYEGGREWTLMTRLLDDKPGVGELKKWARLTSLTVYDGRLFASVGSCTSCISDAPCDVRGKVFSFEAGKNVSYDRDLGSGWQHIAVVKEGGRLKLYINGDLSVSSPPFESEDYDVSSDEPLKIGCGPIDYFSGKIREVRIYNRPIDDGQVREICQGVRDRLT